MFSLDHTNYARWLPVHLIDVILLETKHQSIHQKFLQKNFEIQKCCMSFSVKVIDQASEQLYEMINGRCGAIAQSTYIAEVDAGWAGGCEDDWGIEKQVLQGGVSG